MYHFLLLYSTCSYQVQGHPILSWNRAGPPTRFKIESRPSSAWTIGGFLGFREKPAFLRNLRNQLPSTKGSHFLTPGRRDTGLHWRHVPVDAYESPRHPPGSLSKYYTFQSPHQLPQASLLTDTHLLSLWRPSLSPALLYLTTLPYSLPPAILPSRRQPCPVCFFLALLWTLPSASGCFFSYS